RAGEAGRAALADAPVQLVRTLAPPPPEPPRRPSDAYSTPAASTVHHGAWRLNIPASSERDALAHRDRPVAAGEPLAEAVSQGELAHVTVDGARRPQAQRQSHVAAEPDGIGGVPRAAVIEERGDPDADQAP